MEPQPRCRGDGRGMGGGGSGTLKTGREGAVWGERGVGGGGHLRGFCSVMRHESPSPRPLSAGQKQWLEGKEWIMAVKSESDDKNTEIRLLNRSRCHAAKCGRATVSVKG